MFDEKEFIKIMNQPALRRQAFSSLVEAYQERVYWKVRKIVIDHEDANDVTQDVFIKIWQNLDKFRADSKLYTWIYRIAVNESLTFIQKKRKKNQISLEDNQLLVNSFDKGVKSGYIDGEEIELKLQKQYYNFLTSSDLYLICGILISLATRIFLKLREQQ
jgi:RNA polymerase sigma-70 factor (ECF subfamily)